MQDAPLRWQGSIRRYSWIDIPGCTRRIRAWIERFKFRDKDCPIYEKVRPFRSVTRCPQGVWAPGFLIGRMDCQTHVHAGFHLQAGSKSISTCKSL